jgi:hypothetical protein
MARRDPIGIRLLTRNGYDWSPRYPLIVEAVNRLKVRSCLIRWGEALNRSGCRLAGAVGELLVDALLGSTTTSAKRSRTMDRLDA